MLKKMLGLLFVLSMVAMLSGCGKGDGKVCDSAVDLTSAECRDDPAGDPLDDDSDDE